MRIQAAPGQTSGQRGSVLGAIMLTLALGVAAVSLLGPLGAGLIDYHVVAEVENQVVGGDAAALLLVAPAAALAGVLALRGHRGGSVLALAPAAFSVYLYTQLALGGDFAARPGNSERFFPLFLLVFLLGLAGLVLAVLRVDAERLPPLSRPARRSVIAVLLAVAFFLVVGLHLRGLVDVLDGPPYGIDYTQSPAVFWIVKWMDLGLVVPLTLVSALGLWRGAPWALVLAYAVVGWGALLGSAVAAMGVVMVLNDDPAAMPAATIVFVGFALAFLALAAWLLAPVLRRA